MLFSLNYPSKSKDRVWALVFLRTMGQIGGGCHQQQTLRGFQKWLKKHSSLKAFLCLWKSSESLCCLSPGLFFSALMIHVTFSFFLFFYLPTSHNRNKSKVFLCSKSFSITQLSLKQEGLFTSNEE